jgi:hypothetical protein
MTVYCVTQKEFTHKDYTMTVQKFTGNFSREESGCTIFVNETIQNITDPAALGLYCYLLTKPYCWNITTKELMKHFKMSKDKAYRLLRVLIDLGLLQRNEIREKGQFVKYHYILKLKPYPEKQDCEPQPEKPLAVNQDTYKTNNTIQNKDFNNTTTSTLLPIPENRKKSQSPELRELIEIYREEFPDNPQPHKRLISTSLQKTMKTFIKRWPEADPGQRPLDLAAFRKYLLALKTYAPKFALSEYETKDGNRKKNGLETFCRWNTLVKFLEEAYS